MKQNDIALLLLSSCLAVPEIVVGQYVGGTYDGYDATHRDVLNIRVDGLSSANVSSLGDSDDGFASAVVLNSRLDGQTNPGDFLLGGSGDGFSLNLYIAPPVSEGVPLAADPFFGGKTDGFDRREVYNFPLDGLFMPSSVFSSSGIRDGFHSKGVFNARIDGGADIASVYSATGIGDGFERVIAANIQLDGIVVTTDPYTSSPNSGDGFDRDHNQNVVLNGQFITSSPFLSSSSGGDGFDLIAVYNSMPEIDLSPEPYTSTASAYDGFDAFASAMIELSPLSSTAYKGSTGGDGFETAAFSPNQMIDGSLSYSIWQSIYFAPSQILSGSADPEADPDGDGWDNAIEYALDMQPMIADPSAPITYSFEGFMSVTVRKAGYQPQAQFLVETSTNVTPWVSFPGISVVETSTNFVGRDNLSIGARPRNFLRLILNLHQ
jgi:hypothetical protein